MNRLRFTPLAERDLLAILEYIAQDAPNRAVDFVDTIRESCELICSQPEMGRIRPEYSGNYRSHAVGNYVIFYRVVNSGVEVHRVLHSARDIRRLL
jgi:toxin ParE1/3/4